MAEIIDRATLSLAAEYAVASELCRRGIYAQLTLGNLKRTDLLAFSDGGKVLKIEVKAKQRGAWPGCKGISSKDSFLVFVDFQGKDLFERPDFYVLNLRNWRSCVKRRFAALRGRDPNRQMELRSGSLPVFPNEISASGKPHVGIAVTPSLIARHKEAWHKIEEHAGIG